MSRRSRALVAPLWVFIRTAVQEKIGATERPARAVAYGRLTNVIFVDVIVEMPKTLHRTSKLNTTRPNYAQLLARLKQAVPHALDTARHAYGQLLPEQQSFQRTFTEREMVDKYLRMTPMEQDALRQQVGDEEYNVYVLAMRSLLRKMGAEPEEYEVR